MRRVTRDAVALIMAGRILITPHKHWTQNTSARTKEGNSAGPRCLDALRWCGIGSLFAFEPTKEVEKEALNLLSEACSRALPGERNVVSVNDRLGHSAILSVFDKAIAEADV